MKRIIVTIVFAFAVNAVLAQTYNMKIKQGAGSTYSATSTVDEITFLNTATTPFVCGDVILYGGETYPTVQIESQCWFQKNLNVGTRIAGSSNQTSGNGIEKYCYNNLDANCVTYGGLYQWNEAMQYTTSSTQGICPNGWHIPTYAELQTLKSAVVGDGNALKAIGQGTGTNTSGFSALLAGFRGSDGNFVNIGYYAYFWSSTKGAGGSDTGAYYVRLYGSNSDLLFGYGSWEGGFSVRCLKD
jgi:uncharacterized protein (TIGR02145 family)